jgi:sterol desaturase/sphingolipid hydroxylase (fatty acid hydroxylase superfamily)
MDPFSFAADLVQQNLLVPLLFQLGLMQWQEPAYGWALFSIYGFAQVMLTFAVCMPLERWRPIERWADSKTVATDILYTVIARAGILPLVTFVGFYNVRDFTDYWRHRFSHRLGWWYALHSLHHAQRQMTFWSDDRNHVLDDLISALWFGIIALLIGISPFQFPLLVLLLRFIESLSHANIRLSFGRLGERMLISPRFHRAHHGVLSAGQRSCNYGAVLPWWDMMFGTADFTRDFVSTGDPSAEEAMATGTYLAQQRAGLRRMSSMLRRSGDQRRRA